MRILHVYKDYYPVLGGIENHIKVLAEAQGAAGHKVIVLVCDPGRGSRFEELNGVLVIKAGRLGTFASMPLSLRQWIYLARLHPDVVHVHSPYPLGEVGAWLLKPRVPMVVTYHSDVVRQKGWLKIYGPILRRVLRRAARILPTSSKYLDSSAWLQPVRDRCTVVPLGVDHQRFSLPSEPFSGPPTLLFVGRLRYYKGLDTLLRAMVHLPEDVRLRVVGTGPMLEPWKSLAAQLDLDSRVEFVGEVSDADLPAQYHRASLFVLPANARSEAFGMVLTEAMASGLACVTTEVGTGTSWVVQDGVTGAVVPPEDPQALADSLVELLSRPARLREMGAAGRVRVETELTQDRLVDRVMQVYESLV